MTTSSTPAVSRGSAWLWIAAIGAVALAVLCFVAFHETPEHKATRLSDDQGIACLEARIHRERGDSDATSAEARCDVATREYNAFLAGR